MTGQAQLAISLDFEIGWGVWELERWRERQPANVYTDLRPVLANFVGFLAERDIALIWATVGAMICAPKPDDFDYLPAAARDHISRFLQETDVATHDGRDLFDCVLSCRTTQEFASHSFSHTRFDYPGLTHEMRTEDLRRSRSELARAGVPVDRLVFPENIVAEWEALAASGIRLARTPIKARPRSRITNAVRANLAGPPMAVQDTGGAGVAAQSGSLFFNWYGRAAPLRRKLVNAQARRGLEHAIRTGGTLHLWLHPFNLTATPGLYEDFTAFLALAADHRDRGELGFGGFVPQAAHGKEDNIGTKDSPQSQRDKAQAQDAR